MPRRDKTPGKKSDHPVRPPLPDVARWQPRTDATDNLTESFKRRCRYADRRLRLRFEEEQSSNIDNFDSGVSLEEIFRDEVDQLLPCRYQITTGVLVDRRGHTAGHCDAVIFNETWFPAIKGPASRTSRRPFLPIEGAYAVVEIKSSLTTKSLDDAMEKLVICQRLFRPHVSRDRVTENRETGSCQHFISNPLYSAIFAVDIDGADFDTLVTRFVHINRMLKRHEMVRALIVLGRGCVVWGYFDGESVRPALMFKEDRIAPIFSVFLDIDNSGTAMYPFIQNLSSHLYHSVLAAEDIATHYGESTDYPNIKPPIGNEFDIAPDVSSIDSFVAEFGELAMAAQQLRMNRHIPH
ncbi:DUF6602 domain-containing protein [Nocardia takedensis]